MTIRHAAATAAIVLSIAGTVLQTSPGDALAPSPTASSGDPHRAPVALPAAVTEDSCAAGVRRCVWDGRHRGNHRGRSFILTRRDGDFRVWYVRHRRAHRLIAAWCAKPTVDCRY